MGTPEKFVGRVEAAQLLSCSPQTIDKFIRAKKLPAYHLGRKVVIKWADVLELLGVTQ
jgi:excisionase family DNA binding protein